MKMRAFSVAIVCLAFCIQFEAPAAPAETPHSIALTGRVNSAEEGPMEGVLISAKKAGSTMTITVVSDDQGRYRFPSPKLAPGEYSLRIRAVGYDLESPASVTVGATDTTTA